MITSGFGRASISRRTSAGVRAPSPRTTLGTGTSAGAGAGATGRVARGGCGTGARGSAGGGGAAGSGDDALPHERSASSPATAMTRANATAVATHGARRGFMCGAPPRTSIRGAGGERAAVAHAPLRSASGRSTCSCRCSSTGTSRRTERSRSLRTRTRSAGRPGHRARASDAQGFGCRRDRPAATRAKRSSTSACDERSVLPGVLEAP